MKIKYKACRWTKRVSKTWIQQVEILASVDARSAGVGGYFAARPLADRVPLMHWIADRRRENDSRLRIQLMVVL